MRTGGGFASLARWAGAAILFLSLVSAARRWAPLSRNLPATVYSNGHPAQRRWIPYIQFLRDVEPRLPRGATVLLVQPGIADRWLLEYRWLLAQAELPDQNLVPIDVGRFEARDRPSAPYAIAFGGDPRSPRYRLLGKFSGGTLSGAVR
ncbi:MAG: hypothetical protein ACRD16_06365 [Thermoanaerobaculia bacterium]